MVARKIPMPTAARISHFRLCLVSIMSSVI